MPKSVDLRAIQWTGDNWREVYDFSRGGERNLARVYGPHPDDSVNIDTIEGMARVAKGDLIVRSPDGALTTIELAAAIREDRAAPITEALNKFEDFINLPSEYEDSPGWRVRDYRHELWSKWTELRKALEAARKARAG